MEAGISLPATHNVIVADRSESGLVAIASILESCPLADGPISAWHNSTAAFFIFVAEHDTGRIGAQSAATLNHLLDTILPELFDERLMPPANPEFDIFVDDLHAATIHDCVVQRQIFAALEAGRPVENDLISAEPRPKKREPKPAKPNPPVDLSRGEREKSVRFLCRLWSEARGARSLSFSQPKYSDFEAWLKGNGYAHYLINVSERHPDMDAEAWFYDEVSRTAEGGD